MIRVTSRGFHLGKRTNQKDFLTDYLRYALRKVGLETIRFLYLQGIAAGHHAATTTVNVAIERIG